jgi:hypothetical protein
MIITNPCQKVGEEWISAGTSLFGAKNFRISKMGTMFMNSWRMVILHELLKWLYNFLNYWWMDMQVHTILSSDHLGHMLCQPFPYPERRKHRWIKFTDYCLLALVSGALLLLGLLSGGVPSVTALASCVRELRRCLLSQGCEGCVATWGWVSGVVTPHRTNTGVIQDYIEEFSIK